MFPAYVRNADDAIDYLVDWVDLLGGYILDGLDVQDLDGGGIAIESFHVELPDNRIMTVSLVVDGGLAPSLYKFDLRSTTGVFLWRLDMHPGHESEHGGLTHLHIGPTNNLRIGTPAATLTQVAERIRASD